MQRWLSFTAIKSGVVAGVQFQLLDAVVQLVSFGCGATRGFLRDTADDVSSAGRYQLAELAVCLKFLPESLQPEISSLFFGGRGSCQVLNFSRPERILFEEWLKAIRAQLPPGSGCR